MSQSKSSDGALGKENTHGSPQWAVLTLAALALALAVMDALAVPVLHMLWAI